MNKIILITGATSGIGYATALKFASNGYDLILTGRRLERLEALKQKIESENGREVLLLNFDVRDYNALKLNIDSLSGKWKHVNILLNNAGLALGLSDLPNGLLSDWETMIDTNFKGLLYMTKEISQLMIENGNRGQIINIGSVAGKEVYPKGNVYCATKHAVDALTRATRIDLLPHQIKVTAINPGMLETEFSLVRYHQDEEKAKSVYQGMQPLLPEDIAEVIYFAASQPPHVCLNDITLTSTAQASAREVLRT